MKPTPFDDTPHGEGYFVSFDQDLIDPAFVIKEITTSYWGSWRTPIIILRSMEHSICAGLYKRDRITGDHEDFSHSVDTQVGFARVVTDYSTIAYLCDVVVAKAEQGRGLGKFLIDACLHHPELKDRAWLLMTHDAHELYAKFGFKKCEAMKMLPTDRSG